MRHCPVDGPVAVPDFVLAPFDFFQLVLKGSKRTRGPKPPLIAARFGEKKIPEQNQIPQLYFLRALRGGHLEAKVGFDPK